MPNLTKGEPAHMTSLHQTWNNTHTPLLTKHIDSTPIKPPNFFIAYTCWKSLNYCTADPSAWRMKSSAACVMKNAICAQSCWSCKHLTEICTVTGRRIILVQPSLILHSDSPNENAVNFILRDPWPLMDLKFQPKFPVVGPTSASLSTDFTVHVSGGGYI